MKLFFITWLSFANNYGWNGRNSQCQIINNGEVTKDSSYAHGLYEHLLCGYKPQEMSMWIITKDGKSDVKIDSIVYEPENVK